MAVTITTDPAVTLRNPNQDDVEIDNINDKISESQLLINETVAIMDNNIQVLYGREAMLGKLEERAAHLAVDATTFQNRSNHLKQNLFESRECKSLGDTKLDTRVRGFYLLWILFELSCNHEQNSTVSNGGDGCGGAV
ncbi:hypothetical protein O0L34_g8917 [Tuta absoluta]|nr:hypothetical protein O0L34_g8917 [Tuta absoluta]